MPRLVCCRARRKRPGACVRQSCYAGSVALYATRLWLGALDLYLILARLRLGDVVGRVQTYPGFRCGAEGLG